MQPIKWMERSMGMGQVGWDRHANPRSVYSRFSILPLFAVAVWSRVWIGWYALVPIALVLVWTRVNPHLFSPPRTTMGWASRGVMGERVWINRGKVGIPESDAAWATGLSILSGVGVAPLAYGLWRLDLGWTVAGVAMIMIAKAWFLDRVVQLFYHMSDHPEYAAWRR